MALSSRELNLVLRAKNEASSALNSLGRDFDKARRSAELMGADAARSHLLMEQAAARNAKAQSEYALQQLESQRAVAQQTVAQEQATQKMLAWNQATLEGQKSAQQHTMSMTQQRQAIDQNAVALLQNAKAHNEVRIEQLRGVEGAGAQITALRNQNLVLKEQINTVRDGIIARQNDVNGQKAQISSTQQLINVSKEHQQVAKQNVLMAQESVRSYDGQIQAQRNLIAQQRVDIANRQEYIAAAGREIDAIKKSNAERDVQNQKLRDTGSSMVTAGTAMTAGGAIALAGMFQLTQSAVDYEKATAMTKTQVRETGVTLKDLGDIGLQVARDFGVPFDTIQKGFFDIFSSTDATVKQATVLLRDFAKAAVAGGVDIEKAGTTTIGVMNAWHRPIEDSTKILDTQFKIVQLGRTNYDQLSSSIGRSIPSAVRAGQSFETLGGMIAYMTRSGATAAQATTSAGRALDLFANSKVVERLKDMGINARDASGNFRPLADVVVELQEKLGKLDPAKRAEEIDALFKGSGNNIQARRFWDLVLASDQGSASFKKMVEDVTKSGGSLEEAYKTMSDTMAARNEKMINQWKALGIEAGTALFPAMEKIANKLSELAEWFNNLSEGQQQFIAWAVVIGGALAVVGGAIVIVGGAVATMIGVFGGLAVVAGGIALLIGGAFIAAWIYAYNTIGWFHDAVNWWFQHLWGFIQWFFEGWKGAITGLIDAFKNLGTSFGETWQTIKDGLSAFWSWFTEGWTANFDKVKQQVTDFWAWITGNFDSGTGQAKFPLDGFWAWFINGWTSNLERARQQVVSFWTWITGDFNSGTGQAKFPLDGFWAWWMAGWGRAFDDAKPVIQGFWNWLTGNFNSETGKAKFPLDSFWSWFITGWTANFEKTKQQVSAFWSWLSPYVTSALGAVKNVVVGFFTWFISGWASTFASARSGVSAGATAIVGVITSLVNTIRTIFASLVGQGYSIGANIVNGIRNGVIGAAGYLAAAAASVVTNALAAARAAISINSPSKLFASKVGAPISEGMAKGVLDNADMLNSAVARVSRGAVGAAASAGQLLNMAQNSALNQLSQQRTAQAASTRDSSSLAPVGGYGRGGGGQVVVNVYTNEIDPRRNAMLLGTELSNQIG